MEIDYVMITPKDDMYPGVCMQYAEQYVGGDTHQ